MQVDFTPEQEAQLVKMATESGAAAEQLVKQATLRLMAEAARFRAGVGRGLEAADRGEFVESSEVWAKVEAILEA